MAARPNTSPRSPILFTTIAFIADLPVCILVNQNDISKNEDNPIPSQPKNISRKLSAETKTNIKNVNKDR